MPKVETVVVPTHDFWGGVGEATIPVVAPSALNAIAAATGKLVRTLPLKRICGPSPPNAVTLHAAMSLGFPFHAVVRTSPAGAP